MVEDNIDETTIETQPFNMVEATLVSVREWIDKIALCSLGWMDGQPINTNDMLVVKQRMVKMLILKASNLIQKDIKKLKEEFDTISITTVRMKESGVWVDRRPIYTKEVDYNLDDIVEGIQLSIKQSGYFISQ